MEFEVEFEFGAGEFLNTFRAFDLSSMVVADIERGCSKEEQAHHFGRFAARCYPPPYRG